MPCNNPSSGLSRGRSGSINDFELTADGFIKNAPPRLRGDITYNIICADALVSARTNEKAETYAAKAVSMLKELATDEG